MKWIAAIAILGLMEPLAYGDPEDNLQGRWTTGFITDPDGVFQHRTTHRFTDGRYRFDIDVFLNHPLGQSAWRYTIKGGYALGEPTGVPHVHELDVHIEQIFETALHAETVEERNEEVYCGYDDWVIGVPKDVTGRSCDGEDPAMPGSYYTIVELVPETSVTFGAIPRDGDVGTSPDHRPTELSTDVYTRNGGGGGGDPEEDLLAGFYDVVSLEENAASCEAAQQVPIDPGFQVAEIFANSTIIPAAVGWSLQACQSQAEYEQAPNEIIFASDWPLEQDDGRSDHYVGHAIWSTWTGECAIDATYLTGVRAEDGRVTLQTERWEGVLAEIDTIDDCNADHPAVRPGAPGLTCSRLRTLDLRQR